MMTIAEAHALAAHALEQAHPDEYDLGTLFASKRLCHRISFQAYRFGDDQFDNPEVIVDRRNGSIEFGATIKMLDWEWL